MYRTIKKNPTFNLLLENKDISKRIIFVLIVPSTSTYLAGIFGYLNKYNNKGMNIKNYICIIIKSFLL